MSKIAFLVGLALTLAFMHMDAPFGRGLAGTTSLVAGYAATPDETMYGWARYPLSTMSNEEVSLKTISMLFPTEGWAAGNYNYLDYSSSDGCLLLHFLQDTWLRVPCPQSASLIKAISMATSADGWAIEERTSSGLEMLRYSNGSWGRVPIEVNEASTLNPLFTLSASDVWAVGEIAEYDQPAGQFGVGLILHYVDGVVDAGAESQHLSFE